MTIKIYTIGFTESSTKHFFERLKNKDIKTIIDVRLNNTSQLAGFAKEKVRNEDFSYLLKEICQIDYTHDANLAPNKEILSEWQKNNKRKTDYEKNWQIYKDKFLSLMEQRQIEKQYNLEQFANACLLCSEKEPHFCHRRLVIEYLQSKDNNNIKIDFKHL